MILVSGEYDAIITMNVLMTSVSCMGTVPETIVAFGNSSDFESAICQAISLGGDSDHWLILPEV